MIRQSLTRRAAVGGRGKPHRGIGCNRLFRLAFYAAEARDLIALDAYLKHLPMNYEPHLDRIRRRGRLTFSTRIASLLPLYGRSIGTGRPGLVFFNRAGELVTFDPLNRQDRKKNAHMLILGPTGSGKSATVNSMLLHALATHRPRIYIIDAGRSFDLFGAHCASLGLSVHQVVLEPRLDVSLPPFTGALRLLDQTLSEPVKKSSAGDRQAVVNMRSLSHEQRAFAVS